MDVWVCIEDYADYSNSSTTCLGVFATREEAKAAFIDMKRREADHANKGGRFLPVEPIITDTTLWRDEQEGSEALCDLDLYTFRIEKFTVGDPIWLYVEHEHEFAAQQAST